MRRIGVGYPRVVGDYAGSYGGQAWPHPGTGVYGYIAGAAPVHLPVHPAPHVAIHPPPWRPMQAPGSPPLGEGHVPMPLNPETFSGTWGSAATPAGAPSGTQITFSSRPQKPFKTARLLVRGTKVGATAVGNLIGQAFVGTDLQQGEIGQIDLESIGAATAFDTWLSLKQAEPGVWIRVQTNLTAYPNPSNFTTVTDFETYTVTAIGHYLH